MSEHTPVDVNRRHRDEMKLLDKAALHISALVGTMICAILFAIIAFVSFPQAVESHSSVIVVAWLSSNFLQLVLLPIILVSQNMQSKHDALRADQQYKFIKHIVKEIDDLHKKMDKRDA